MIENILYRSPPYPQVTSSRSLSVVYSSSVGSIRWRVKSQVSWVTFRIHLDPCEVEAEFSESVSQIVGMSFIGVFLRVGVPAKLMTIGAVGLMVCFETIFSVFFFESWRECSRRTDQFVVCRSCMASTVLHPFHWSSLFFLRPVGRSREFSLSLAPIC